MSRARPRRECIPCAAAELSLDKPSPPLAMVAALRLRHDFDGHIVLSSGRINFLLDGARRLGIRLKPAIRTNSRLQQPARIRPIITGFLGVP